MTSSSSAGPVPEPGPDGGLKTTVPGTGVQDPRFLEPGSGPPGSRSGTDASWNRSPEQEPGSGTRPTLLEPC